MSDGTATIEITISHMPGSVAQEAVNPSIEVDGESRQGSWGGGQRPDGIARPAHAE